MVVITADTHGSGLARDVDGRGERIVAPSADAINRRLVAFGVIFVIGVVQAAWFATLAIVLLRLTR